MKHTFHIYILTACLLTFHGQLRSETIENLENLTVDPVQPRALTTLSTQVSIGEFIDKITILQIKKERIADAKKLHNVMNELETLLATHRANLPPSAHLDELTARLLEVNKKLWDIEDAIRDKELHKQFDAQFIELARSVYIVNDERFRIKREINELLGSRLVEEKSYKKYT